VFFHFLENPFVEKTTLSCHLVKACYWQYGNKPLAKERKTALHKKWNTLNGPVIENLKENK